MTIKDVILKEIKGIWGNPPVEGELSTPVIKTNNMTYEGYIDYDDITYRSIPDNKIASCFLKRGDLLVEKSGGTKTHSVGYVNIFNKENDVFVCNNFIVGLRPDNTVILSEYLFFQMKYFYEIGIFSDCYNKTTGIQNLQLQTYLSKPIVCPEKAEQKKVVSTLSNIVKALDNKKEQLKKLDELIQSKFYEMFGDIVTNKKGWPIEKLEDVGSFARGVSRHRPRNAPELLGGTMPLIQTGDIANAGMYITTYSTTYSDLGVLQSKVWPAGTLCITIAANIGKCSILTFDACFPDSVVGYTIKQNKIKNEFVYYLFGELQAILEANALGVAQKNINLKTLNSLEVPLPPLPLQQAFAAYVEKVEQAKAIVNQEIAHLQELLDSRMDFYFRK